MADIKFTKHVGARVSGAASDGILHDLVVELVAKSRDTAQFKAEVDDTAPSLSASRQAAAQIPLFWSTLPRQRLVGLRVQLPARASCCAATARPADQPKVGRSALAKQS